MDEKYRIAVMPQTLFHCKLTVLNIFLINPPLRGDHLLFVAKLYLWGQQISLKVSQLTNLIDKPKSYKPPIHRIHSYPRSTYDVILTTIRKNNLLTLFFPLSIF